MKRLSEILLGEAEIQPAHYVLALIATVGLMLAIVAGMLA